MAPSFKGSSSADRRAYRRASSFESALEALESDAEATSAYASLGNLTIPLGSVSAPLGADSDRATPGRWEAHYELTEEASATEIPPQPRIFPSASAEAIARELNLNGARTASELHMLRREFMWRNHPDRRPEIPRDLANARVAVANMLIDRALRRAAVKSDSRT